MQYYQKVIFTLVVSIMLLFSPTLTMGFAQESTKLPNMFKDANEHFMLGEYRQAIEIYDEILEISPTSKKTSLMKGIALSNLERHKSSILEFYKVNQQDSQSVTALVGLGVGFGNLGEYKEALTYFEQAYRLQPENHIVKNYYEFATKTVEKYPYNEVEKPEYFEINLVEMVPVWVKNTAGWWANDQIEDAEFLTSMQFLIKNGLLVIELSDMEEMTDEERKTSDRNRWQFARYLDKIEKTVSEDKRYIEYPNPSNDVIKKFLRDYAKWNFEQQIKIGNKSFPNPNFVLIDEVYHVEYKIYINRQPHGLPLDHVGTLDSSFKYWEDQELKSNDGKPVKIHFITTKSQAEANLWVTWVVRDIGENVLGHANLGKGVIEVALGGYGCDGNFQLFDVETVEIIMTHELGHGVGLKHSTNTESIMYPTIKEVKYAYCLLDISD